MAKVYKSLDDAKKDSPKKKNKFGAKRTEYNGVTYHSKKEADRRKQLDFMTKLSDKKDRVVKVEDQAVFRIEVEGIHICKYILDFKVTYADGRVEYEDVKGYKKGGAYQMFKLKKKLVEAIYGIEILEK